MEVEEIKDVEEEEVKETKEKKIKKEKKHSFFKAFFGLPKLVKYTLIIMVIITLASMGTMFGTVYKNTSTPTQFGLENVGILVTQTAHVTEVSDTKVNREFFNWFQIPFSESRQIFSIQVDVDASVDFDKISYKQDNSEKTVVVSLPHAEIYKATPVEDSLKVYLDDGSLFSRIDLSKNNEARLKLRDDAVETAKANGILDAADKNAQILIERLIKSNRNYHDYKVFFNYING